MKATINQNHLPGSDRHDETMVGDGCVRLSAILHGRDDLVWMPDRAVGDRPLSDASRSPQQTDEEVRNSALIDRLMAYGLPVFAWGALAVGFLKISIQPITIAMVGIAGVAFIAAVGLAIRHAKS